MKLIYTIFPPIGGLVYEIGSPAADIPKRLAGLGRWIMGNA